MKLTLINDLDYLFGQIDTDTLTCPFCDKEYVNKKSFDKHIEKARETGYACVKPLYLFEDTATEEYGLQYYIDLMNMFYKKPVRVTTQSFRSSKIYTSMCEYVLFTMDKHLGSLEYMRFVFRQFKVTPKAPAVILKKAKEERTLADYFKFRRHHQDWIRSDEFFERHKDNLEADDRFLMKSLRRGDIAFEFCFDKLNLQERYHAFDLDLQVQMEELLDEEY